MRRLRGEEGEAELDALSRLCHRHRPDARLVRPVRATSAASVGRRPA